MLKSFPLESWRFFSKEVYLPCRWKLILDKLRGTSQIWGITVPSQRTAPGSLWKAILCSLPRIIIFKAFIEELITKCVAHKKTLHHAFQFFKYALKNFISQHMFWGRFLHDSTSTASQSFCLLQFSSRSTWNPMTLIFFQYEEYTFWIHALNFSFQIDFLWIGETNSYFLVTVSPPLRDSAIKLELNYQANMHRHQTEVCLLIPITFKHLTGKLLLQIQTRTSAVFWTLSFSKNIFKHRFSPSLLLLLFVWHLEWDEQSSPLSWKWYPSKQ